MDPSSVVGGISGQPQRGYEASQALSSVTNRWASVERRPIQTPVPQQLIVCATATQSSFVVHERSSASTCWQAVAPPPPPCPAAAHPGDSASGAACAASRSARSPASRSPPRPPVPAPPSGDEPWPLLLQPTTAPRTNERNTRPSCLVITGSPWSYRGELARPARAVAQALHARARALGIGGARRLHAKSLGAAGEVDGTGAVARNAAVLALVAAVAALV